MTHWAIREKATGLLMPSTNSRKSRTKFTDYGPPRLFMTVGGAKTALRMWCQGIWGTERSFESTNEYGDGFYYKGLPIPLHKDQRDPNLYEVVRIELFIHSN